MERNKRSISQKQNRREEHGNSIKNAKTMANKIQRINIQHKTNGIQTHRTIPRTSSKLGLDDGKKYKKVKEKK